MEYVVNTFYLSASGVVNRSRSFSSRDEAINFAFDCITSDGYDSVKVMCNDFLVLSYSNNLKFLKK